MPEYDVVWSGTLERQGVAHPLSAAIIPSSLSDPRFSIEHGRSVTSGDGSDPVIPWFGDLRKMRKAPGGGMTYVDQAQRGARRAVAARIANRSEGWACDG